MKDEDGKVALLVDFENLVFGLKVTHGDDYAEYVEPEVLFRLAEEYGQVVLANAYADWRSRDVNQFQIDLYRLGIELVHVLGKRQQNRLKNAVDIKMAVDAVETVWTLPQVRTFVIVSGDRDFIHVLKALRRHGKTVVGISPDQSVSEDFASLCDRFVRYGALLASNMPEGTASMEAGLETVRTALRDILAERPDGLKGAQVKPLLRRRLSATFDESEYGFSRLTDLLLALPDVAKIADDRRGGDITVLPAGSATVANGEVSLSSTSPHRDAKEDDSVRDLAKAAGLPRYAYDTNAEKRRRILSALFAAMKGEEPFALADVFERTLQDDESLGVSISRLAKYQALLWQSRAFSIELDQKGKPVRERLTRLDPSIATDGDLIFRYEASVAYKLAAAAKANGQGLTVPILRRVLGLPDTPMDAEHCAKLIAHLG